MSVYLYSISKSRAGSVVMVLEEFVMKADQAMMLKWLTRLEAITVFAA